MHACTSDVHEIFSHLLLSVQVHHIYICDYHKNFILNFRLKRKRQNSEMEDSSDNEFNAPEVRITIQCFVICKLMQLILFTAFVADDISGCRVPWMTRKSYDNIRSWCCLTEQDNVKLLVDALHFIHSCLQIDFYSMPVNTLRRFKKHYKLPSRPGLTKAQLADVSAAACCCCMHFIFLVMLQLFFFVTSLAHSMIIRCTNTSVYCM